MVFPEVHYYALAGMPRSGSSPGRRVNRALLRCRPSRWDLADKEWRYERLIASIGPIDVFLEAARRARVEPEVCVAFDDSEFGLLAAARGVLGIDTRTWV